jgi:hypothetical protein
MLMSRLALAAVALVTIGCAGTRPRAGQPTDEWLSRWGPPHVVATRGDGNRVLTWEHRYFGSFWQTFTCRRTVTATPTGQVVGYAEADCGRWF